ncbi:MAG: serine hydrolase domain-containing protein [Acidimicrobiales bacterium]
MPASFDLVRPESVGLNAAQLAIADTHMAANYLETGRYPGFSLLVSRHGQVAHLSAQGFADIEEQRPLTTDSIVRIYSMSKPITSVALMQLYEQGRFQLTDPVAKFIPSFARLKVWADGTPANYSTKNVEREMTVQDLLRHTSGLTYGFIGNHPVDAIYRKKGVSSPATSLADFCEILSDIPLLFSPGTRWAYSVATDVAGHLVELISGQSLDAYFQDHIFDPLGMVDTGFSVPDEKADRLASNYAHPAISPFGVPEGADPDTLMLKLEGNGETASARHTPAFLSGGGGLNSTLADYHRFCSMLLNGGQLDGVRILGRKTVQYMASNHLPSGGDLASMGQPVFSETSYEGIGFGLGFSVVLDPCRSGVLSSPGEFAWGGAASTLFWIDPAEDLIVIGFTQLMPSSAYPSRAELKAIIYSAITS